jgi:hypothetical protein
MTTLKKIIIVCAIIIIAAILIWQGILWWQTKQLKIQQGLASDKFPYRDYTQEELNKMYPQVKNADVPTRTTPEQTYAKFREALKTNNLEMAIEQLDKDSKRYEENKKDLGNAYKENKFIEIYNSYPEKIEKQYMAESIASYYFLEKRNGKNFRVHISFTKNSSGDWKIDIF